MGQIAGIAYREVRDLMRQVDWQEVGTLVLHGIVAAVVLTYCLGLWTGRAVHKSSEWLAKRWPTRPATAAEVRTEQKAVLVTQHRVCVVRHLQPVARARYMKARGMSQRAISRELGIPRTTLRRMMA